MFTIAPNIRKHYWEAGFCHSSCGPGGDSCMVTTKPAEKEGRGAQNTLISELERTWGVLELLHERI